MPLIDQTTDLLVTHLPIAQQINYVISHFHQIHYGIAFSSQGNRWQQIHYQVITILPIGLPFYFLFRSHLDILLTLHIVWTGVGVFFFSKKKNLHNFSALFAASCWMGNSQFNRIYCRWSDIHDFLLILAALVLIFLTAHQKTIVSFRNGNCGNVCISDIC